MSFTGPPARVLLLYLFIFIVSLAPPNTNKFKFVHKSQVWIVSLASQGVTRAPCPCPLAQPLVLYL